MINNRIVEKKAYKAFGLTVLSEIPLPELPQLSIQDDLADITIEIKDLSDMWECYSVQNERFVITEEYIMFKISEAIFYIQNGERIFVSPIIESELDRIRLFILGTCMGIILIQRKTYALHGSAIVIDGKAYAIVGDSGAGKSTLAAEFLTRGYKLLSDDVIPISFSQHTQVPMVLPAYPQQKLWLESLRELGMESRKYKPICGREEKFSIPLTTSFIQEPLPLAGVFELTKSNVGTIEIQPIHKLERIQTLYYHTYRNFIIQRLGLMDWHFAESVKISKEIYIFQLRRPKVSFTAPKLASLILDTIYREEHNHDKKSHYFIK
ncbi:aldolase [Neobacillus cucumis]|nr:aldolase [Neobacillus cucumis]